MKRGGNLRVLLSLALLAVALPGRADLLDEVNLVRTEGCARGAPGVAKLRPRRALHAAARLLSQGHALDEALEAAGYVATASASVSVASRGNDRAIGNILRERFCARVTDVRFTEIGVYRAGDRRWLVLAQPFSAAALKDARQVSERVLALVNEARSRERRCGRERYPAASALSLAAPLHQAARAHAEDMARHAHFDHTGSDGSTVGQRLERTGYRRRLVGENIAAGPTTPEEVVRGWLDSPEHCANLMDRRFRHMGVAYVVRPASRHRVYWAQVLAAPR